MVMRLQKNVFFCPRRPFFVKNLGFFEREIFDEMHKFAVVISSEMLCRTALATSACGL